MVIIGLVGGVASGKSAVSAALARRGAIVFDADQIGHRVIDEPEVRDELVARWGRAILHPDGAVNRAAVAERVFGNTPETLSERRFLEQALHPRIRQRILMEINRLPNQAAPAVVIDAPLLVESGWNEICQIVIFVDSPCNLRLQRALARGWTEEEFSRREAAQMPIEQKRRWATQVVTNSGSLADLETEVDRFWTAAIT